jgi:hypothetical protein
VEFKASPQLAELFDRDSQRRSGVTTFAALLNEIAERDFCGRAPLPLCERLRTEFQASGATQLEAWISAKLASVFRCVSHPPRWINEPEWPFAGEEAFVFVEQFELPFKPRN